MRRRTVGGSRLRGGAAITMETRIGDVELPSPVLTASGTAGHGDELARYVDLASIGAVVVKSMRTGPWPGNAPPRVHETPAGMINSVGLQGDGARVWLRDELPPLLATGARVVASIWGRTVEEYAEVAGMLAGAPREVVAVEVNVSCPNVEDRGRMFAHSPERTAEVIAATEACGRPRWAKLSPNVTDLVPIAAAARDAGAAAVTLTNTMMGMVIDLERRRPLLGGRGGGLSGPAIHPIVVRAVFDVHAALGDLPIVGVGGVVDGETAIELMMAGASAIQVGTATFADPRAVAHVHSGMVAWCRHHGVSAVHDVIGAAHS
jgi:dihydroorotate dehydrogenase (NAD+) catalytic subunit